MLDEDPNGTSLLIKPTASSRRRKNMLLPKTLEIILPNWPETCEGKKNATQILARIIDTYPVFLIALIFDEIKL
jgi:hypothetical protein